ncbi:MAG: hypothetical protein WDN23_08210 [Edaphobacter sp.]
MKREDGVRAEGIGHDEVAATSLFPFGSTGSDSNRLMEELRQENAGLRRLVGELLVANQQLRERYGLGRREGEGSAPPLASRGKDWIEAKAPFG